MNTGLVLKFELDWIYLFLLHFTDRHIDKLHLTTPLVKVLASFVPNCLLDMRLSLSADSPVKCSYSVTWLLNRFVVEAGL